MAVIEIVLNEQDHTRLQDEYNKMCETWSRMGHAALPPTFEQWLGVRTAEMKDATAAVDLDDMRLFSAIERLVTSLPQHGFSLAHVVKQGVSRTEATRNLADLVVRDFKLPAQYSKRIEDLFEHYVKDAREVADQAQLVVTNRTFGALNEVHRQLVERTETSIQRLGPDRAIGRVEGAAAVLVGMEVLSRESAREKTNAFKVLARSAPKGKWTDKIFKGSDPDE
ncbi:MAG TPA: hypothetical protein VIF60_04900 [Burkholderiaceae bacterium]|jgi:hypothetical protein